MDWMETAHRWHRIAIQIGSADRPMVGSEQELLLRMYDAAEPWPEIREVIRRRLLSGSDTSSSASTTSSS